MFLYIISLISIIYCLLNTAINSRTKYWELFTIIPIQIQEFIILMFIIYSAITANIYCAISFIISFFLLLPFLDYSFSTKKDNSKHQKNIISFLDMNTLFFYPKNPLELVKYIQDKDKDIIFLQELFIGDNLQAIEKKIVFPSVKAIGFIEDSYIKLKFTNYKYFIKSNDRLILPKAPLEKIFEYSPYFEFGFLICKIIINNKEIYLINVHMPFKIDKYFGYIRRKEAFNMLNEQIKKIEEKGSAFILCGDFNTAKASKFITNLFDKYTEGVHNTSLGLHTSWHTKRLSLWRMDFVFSNSKNAFFCTKARLIKTKFSDHKSIEAEFSINS